MIEPVNQAERSIAILEAMALEWIDAALAEADFVYIGRQVDCGKVRLNSGEIIVVDRTYASISVWKGASPGERMTAAIFAAGLVRLGYKLGYHTRHNKGRTVRL